MRLAGVPVKKYGGAEYPKPFTADHLDEMLLEW